MTSLCVKLYLRRDFIGRWVQPSLPWASMAQGSSRLNRNTSKGKQFARHNVRYFSHRLNFQNSFFLNVKVLRFRCSNCLGEFSITLRNGGYVGVSNADVGELLHSLEGSIFDSWALQWVGAQFYKCNKHKALFTISGYCKSEWFCFNKDFKRNLGR